MQPGVGDHRKFMMRDNAPRRISGDSTPLLLHNCPRALQHIQIRYLRVLARSLMQQAFSRTSGDRLVQVRHTSVETVIRGFASLTYPRKGQRNTGLRHTNIKQVTPCHSRRIMFERLNHFTLPFRRLTGLLESFAQTFVDLNRTKVTIKNLNSFCLPLYKSNTAYHSIEPYTINHALHTRLIRHDLGSHWTCYTYVIHRMHFIMITDMSQPTRALKLSRSRVLMPSQRPTQLRRPHRDASRRLTTASRNACPTNLQRTTSRDAGKSATFRAQKLMGLRDREFKYYDLSAGNSSTDCYNGTRE